MYLMTSVTEVFFLGSSTGYFNNYLPTCLPTCNLQFLLRVRIKQNHIALIQTLLLESGLSTSVPWLVLHG